MTTSHAEADTDADREDSAVDLTALAAYLDTALDGGVQGELSAGLISGGRSNPTYRVADADRTWVLRRPPYGHVLPSAHDMKREFTVIRGLAGTAVPVPEAVLLCEDKSVLGAPFYLMELVDGMSVGTVEQASALTPDDRRRLGLALADTLAELHGVDPHAVGWVPSAAPTATWNGNSTVGPGNGRPRAPPTAPRWACCWTSSAGRCPPVAFPESCMET